LKESKRGDSAIATAKCPKPSQETLKLGFPVPDSMKEMSFKGLILRFFPNLKIKSDHNLSTKIVCKE